MKTLQEYILEQMVCELSSTKLTQAYRKEKEKNGHETNRARKFKKGAHDALDRELKDKDIYKDEEVYKLEKKCPSIVNSIENLGFEFGDIWDSGDYYGLTYYKGNYYIYLCWNQKDDVSIQIGPYDRIHNEGELEPFVTDGEIDRKTDNEKIANDIVKFWNNIKGNKKISVQDLIA